MTSKMNMAVYARMLSGLDPMLHQLDQPELLVEPQPGDNYAKVNIDKIDNGRNREQLGSE